MCNGRFRGAIGRCGCAAGVEMQIYLYKRFVAQSFAFAILFVATLVVYKLFTSVCALLFPCLMLLLLFVKYRMHACVRMRVMHICM